MKLDPDPLQQILRELPAWQFIDERGGVLRRDFKLRDFAQALRFMNAVAVHAETHDHHPEWSNVYNRVAVTLITHDAGGVTMKDIALAREMERVAAMLQEESPQGPQRGD